MPPPAFSALHPTLTPTPSEAATTVLKPYVRRLTVNKKLAIVFKAIDKDAHWTFSELATYRASRHLLALLSRDLRRAALPPNVYLH
jgi:hypothetical protein